MQPSQNTEQMSSLTEQQDRKMAHTLQYVVMTMLYKLL